MKKITIDLLKEKTLIDYGSILFLLGIFFLPSTMIIGLLFLIPAFIVSKEDMAKLNIKYWQVGITN